MTPHAKLGSPPKDIDAFAPQAIMEITVKQVNFNKELSQTRHAYH